MPLYYWTEQSLWNVCPCHTLWKKQRCYQGERREVLGRTALPSACARTLDGRTAGSTRRQLRTCPRLPRRRCFNGSPAARTACPRARVTGPHAGPGCAPQRATSAPGPSPRAGGPGRVRSAPARPPGLLSRALHGAAGGSGGAALANGAARCWGQFRRGGGRGVVLRRRRGARPALARVSTPGRGGNCGSGRMRLGAALFVHLEARGAVAAGGVCPWGGSPCFSSPSSAPGKAPPTLPVPAGPAPRLPAARHPGCPARQPGWAGVRAASEGCGPRGAAPCGPAAARAEPPGRRRVEAARPAEGPPPGAAAALGLRDTVLRRGGRAGGRPRVAGEAAALARGWLDARGDGVVGAGGGRCCLVDAIGLLDSSGLRGCCPGLSSWSSSRGKEAFRLVTVLLSTMEHSVFCM